MIRILAASIVRNSSRFIRPLVESLHWVDTHVIVDDRSGDGSRELIEILCAEYPRLQLVEPWFPSPMLPIVGGRRVLAREQDIRSRFIELLYENYQFDALVLVDADEVMHSALRQAIALTLAEGHFDSIALECNHLVSKESRLRIFEQSWNGTAMVDPHVRILLKKRTYEPGSWIEVPDCFISPTERTRCLSGPYHFHLKYLESLGGVPLASVHLSPYMRATLEGAIVEQLPAGLPSDLGLLIDTYLS